MTAYTASLNGLQIGDGTDFKFATEPTGLGSGSYRVSRIDRRSDGIRAAGPDLLPSRMVTFDLELFDGRQFAAGGSAAVEQDLDLLKAAWQPVTSGVVALTLELSNGERLLYGRPVEVEVDLTQLLYGIARARCVFEATDPRLFSSTLSSITLGLTAGGGMTFPLTFPLTFGAGSDSDGVAVNTGTYRTPWTATITGPVTTPRLTLASTGEYVELDGDIPAGSSLVVSSDDQSILFNGSPRQSWLTLASRWWQLPAGSNTVRFRAAAGSGSCQFSWRSASI
jgi:hypothetical protein